MNPFYPLHLGRTLFVASMAFWATGCTKTETIAVDNTIHSFRITNVPEGESPVYGAINHADNTIKVYLPFYYLLPVVSPEIEVASGAKVTPESGQLIDSLFTAFTEQRELTYTVTPTQGPDRVYTLQLETRQGALTINELSTDAANPTQYTLDYTSTGGSYINFGLSGENLIRDIELNALVLEDLQTHSRYDLTSALSLTDNAGGTSLSVYISKFVYRSSSDPGPDVETAIAASLPDDGLYSVTLYSYAEKTTLQYPIRITKKRI